MPSKPNPILLCAALVVALGPAWVSADQKGGDRDRESHRHDHDRARHALERGEVRPLAEVLAQVATQVPGEVVELELEREGHGGARRWVYELKVITPDGRLLEVYADAVTGRILELEED